VESDGSRLEQTAANEELEGLIPWSAKIDLYSEPVGLYRSKCSADGLL
jgi:hypothetical protein